MTAAAMTVIAVALVIFRLGNQASAGVTLDDPVVWIEDGQRGQVLQVNGSTGEITARIAVGERGDSIIAIPSERDAVFLNRTNGEMGVLGAVSLKVDNAILLETTSGVVQGEHLRLEGDLAVATDAYVVDDESLLVVEAGSGIRLPIPTPGGLGSTAVDAQGRLLALTTDGRQIGRTDSRGLIPVTQLPEPVSEEAEPPMLVRAGDEVYVIDPSRRTVNPIVEGDVLGPTTCVAGSLTDVRVGGSHVTTTTGVARILVHDPENGVLSVSEPASSECFDIVVDVPGTEFGNPVAVDGVAYLPNWERGRIEVIDLIERTVLDSLLFSSRPGQPFELEVFDNAVWANEPQGPFAAIVTRRGLRPISKLSSRGVLVEEGSNGEDDGSGAFIAGESDGDGRAFGNSGDSLLGGDQDDGSVSGGDDETTGGDTPASSEFLDQSGLTDPADTPVGVILDAIERDETENDELLANFEFSADTVNVGEEVAFTDASAGTPVSWNWDFGDGTGAEGPEVTKAWDTEGVFTVQLFIADASGRQAQQSIEITVVAVDVRRPPIANFSFRSDTIEAGETLTFTDQSSGDPTALEWDFGDGSTAVGASVAHTFDSPGIYEVTLTAVNEAGSDSTSAAITVVDAVQPPEAIIGPVSTVIETGQSILFRSESTNSPTALSWDFDDGSTETGSEARHSWSSPGTYRVRLTASNSAGSDSTFVDIVVQPRVVPPLARFGESDLDAVVGETLSFNDLSQNNPTRWTWEFGDGSTASGPNVSHAWSEAGVYTVTLTVQNEAGSDEVSKTVTIAPPPPDPPLASFTIPSAVVPVNSIVRFTDTSTNDPTEWLWDFGDGDTSTAQNPPHAFAEPARYEVTLTVTNAGGSTSTSQTIVVSDPPVASFTSEADELSVQFTDTSTNQPTSWSWTFGDGDTSSARNPVKVFDAPGTYIVTLIASNEGGASAEFTAEVTVARRPVAAFSSSVTGLSVELTDESTRNPTFYSWTFGDGNSSSSPSPSHTYADAGTYTVTLTVSNAAGSDSASAPVTVDFAPPIAAFTCSNQGGGSLSCDATSSAGAVAWSWSPAPAAGQGTPNASYLFGSSGTYTVTLTVENPSGASDTTTESFTIDVPTPPEVTSISLVNDNGRITATASATNSPTSWIWSIDNGGTVESGQNTSSAVLRATSNGSYNVEVTVINEDGSDSASQTIVVSDINPPVVSTVTEISNLNGTVELQATATESPDPSGWTWTIPGAASIAGGSTATPTVTFTSNGIYNGSVTASNDDGTSIAKPFSITVDDINPPVVTIESSSNTNGAITATASATPGPVTWNWTINNGGTVINGNSATATFSVTSNGTYQLTATATNEDGVGSASVFVTVSDIIAPTVTITSTSNVNGLITATATATEGPVTWSWSISPSGTVLTQGATATFQVSSNGSYLLTATATNEDGSGSDTATHVVSDINPPVVTIVSTSNVNGTITATATATNSPTSWSWTINNGGTVINGSGATATFSVSANGDYLLTATASNEDGSGSASATHSVTDINPPTVSITITSNSGGTIQASATVGNGFDTLVWSISGPSGSITSGQGTLNATFTVTQNGNYTISLVAENEDGTGNDTAPVTVSDGPIAGFVFDATGAPLIVFTDTSTNASSWSWDFGDGSSSTQQNPSHTFAPGTYTVTLTVSGGPFTPVSTSQSITIP